jgi:sortase A
LGAWRVPESSTPDKGGNTVITGHRFKYLPPSNLTFYLLDKMETGDIISVVYKEKEYYYRVKEIKIVDKTELSILAPTKEPILTIFTCHPIYSTEKRLVVTGDLINFDK